MPAHIHEALRQVRDLHRHILDKQRFRGYSGRARAIGGTLALLTAWILSTSLVPKTPFSHLAVWGGLFIAAVFLNYGALLYWFFFDKVMERSQKVLRPAFEVFPIFFVGGILTIALLINERPALLFGTWMSLFGLANLVSRQVLPRLTLAVGAMYLVSGAWFLLDPRLSFFNPWPMGLVFFIGEWFGAFVFHFDRHGTGNLFESSRGGESEI